MEGLMTLWSETGIANFEFGQICMMLVGCLLLFLAIRKGFDRYFYYRLVLVLY